MTQEVNGERFRVQRPDVVEQLIGDELVVINFGNGRYHGIRAGGVRVWQMLDAGFSLGEIVRSFDADFQVVFADLRRFVAELQTQELIMPDSQRHSPEAQASWPALAYHSAELETRDDMQDFLTLDPIHDVDANGWPNSRLITSSAES